jgi:hypothetical protein
MFRAVDCLAFGAEAGNDRERVLELFERARTAGRLIEPE